MKLVIDDNRIDYDGTVKELHQELAKLLVLLERKHDIPVIKSLRLIGVYSDLVKKDLL